MKTMLKFNHTDVEVWKPIEDAKGYLVSNKGRILSIPSKRKKGKLLKINYSTGGYGRVRLNNKSRYVHRLVAEAFIPNVEGKPNINHKDGTKRNNWVENLEWCTQKENINHAIDLGLIDYSNRNWNKGGGKLTPKEVSQIKSKLQQGTKKADLAREFDVDWVTIYSIETGRSWKDWKTAYCKGEVNGMAKLTTDEVVEIKLLLKKGVSNREIATTYGVSSHAISDIKIGKTWFHISI